MGVESYIRVFFGFALQRLVVWFKKTRAFFSTDLATVVQRLDNAIHLINHHPVDSVVCVSNTYPLDSDLYGG